MARLVIPWWNNQVCIINTSANTLLRVSHAHIECFSRTRIPINITRLPTMSSIPGIVRPQSFKSIWCMWKYITFYFAHWIVISWLVVMLSISAYFLPTCVPSSVTYLPACELFLVFFFFSYHHLVLFNLQSMFSTQSAHEFMCQLDITALLFHSVACLFILGCLLSFRKCHF